MPRFEPFCGVRYDTDRVDLADVIAPPYDVIDEAERTALEGHSPYNAVRVELPRATSERDPYEEARCLLEAWQDAGVLHRDAEPGFYVYRMGFHDDDGRPRQTAGVIGAMEIAEPGSHDVLPHEHTMSKPKDDRLNMLRSCRANLSPIWGLSLAEGLGGLCELPGPPDARATDTDGVHHRLWRITQAGVVDAISQAVASAPVMIADGHHRYETALAFRDQERAAGRPDGGHESIMTFVVELSDEQLCVRPIHRLLGGLPPVDQLLEHLAERFDVFDGGAADPGLTDRMADAGALGLVLERRAWLLRPQAEAFAGVPDLDSARLDHALRDLPAVDLRYQHGADVVTAMVEKGEAEAAVLLRPATVDQISATARARDRMPPKTTFFHPKPRTGLVFRPLDAA